MEISSYKTIEEEIETEISSTREEVSSELEVALPIPLSSQEGRIKNEQKKILA